MSHDGRGETASVREWECLQHYTVINLWWLCAYGPKLLPFEMRDSIFIQGQNESCKKGEADGHVTEETEANEDGWSHRSERKGFKCSKHLALLLQCTRKAGLCVGLICHTKSCTVCPLALQTWHNLSQEHILPLTHTLLLSSVFFSCTGILYLATFFLFPHQHPIYSHPPSCPSLSDTWPGVSMRGIL